MTKPLTLAHLRKKPPLTSSKGPGRRRVTSPVLVLIGARIKQVRLLKGVTQDELAYGIPMDRSQLGLIENGRTAPTVITLLKLASALDCEAGELIPAMAEVRAILRREQQRDRQGDDTIP